MIKTLKSNKETIFVTKKTRITKRGNFNVILSPQFYWVKKVKLPVTNVRSAKKLAKSVFENSLPSGNFSYLVTKSNDEFIIIAYNKEEISKSFEEIFADKKDIKGVYFAQNELKDLNECTIIDAFSALSNIDDLLIQVPRRCTNTSSSIDKHLKDLTLSNKKVNIALTSEIQLSNKTIYAIISVFILFFISFTIEYLTYKSELQTLKHTKSKLIKKYDLPQTMIQIKSIKKSLTKQFKDQKKIKDALYKLSKLKLPNGASITHIEINKENLSVDMTLASALDAQNLQQKVAKEFNIKDWLLQENKITIKIAI